MISQAYSAKGLKSILIQIVELQLSKKMSVEITFPSCAPDSPSLNIFQKNFTANRDKRNQISYVGIHKEIRIYEPAEHSSVYCQRKQECMNRRTKKYYLLTNLTW
jgi:ribosomal protein L19